MATTAHDIMALARETISSLKSRQLKAYMKANELKRSSQDTAADMRAKVLAHFNYNTGGFRIPELDAAHDAVAARIQEAIEVNEHDARQGERVLRDIQDHNGAQDWEGLCNRLTELGFEWSDDGLTVAVHAYGKILEADRYSELSRIVRDIEEAEEALEALDAARAAAALANVADPVTAEAPAPILDNGDLPEALQGRLCRQAKVLAELALRARENAQLAGDTATSLPETEAVDKAALLARALVHREWEATLLQHAIDEQKGFTQRRANRTTAPKERDARLPEGGTILERTYDGTLYRVRIEDDGSVTLLNDDGSDGGAYKSVSGVARAITGAAQNGYRWFKLAGGTQLKATDDETEE